MNLFIHFFYYHISAFPSTFSNAMPQNAHTNGEMKTSSSVFTFTIIGFSFLLQLLFWFQRFTQHKQPQIFADGQKKEKENVRIQKLKWNFPISLADVLTCTLSMTLMLMLYLFNYPAVVFKVTRCLWLLFCPPSWQESLQACCAFLWPSSSVFMCVASGCMGLGAYSVIPRSQAVY